MLLAADEPKRVKTCVFFGCSDYIKEDLVSLKQVKNLIRSLITDFGVTQFISSGNVGSELELEEYVIDLKKEFPHVRLELLSIYEQNTNENLKHLKARYDDIITPPNLNTSRRLNKHTASSYWAVEQSDFCFVHSLNDYGISHKVANKFPKKCLFDLAHPPRHWKKHLSKKILK